MLKGRPYRPDTKKEAGESGGEKKHTSGVIPFRHRQITKQLAVIIKLSCNCNCQAFSWFDKIPVIVYAL